MSVLDAIPEQAGWSRVPFGRVAGRVKETGRPSLPPLSVFLGAGVVPRDSREDNHNQLGEDLGKYLVVRPGDIVFNKLRTWQGGLGASNYEGIVSPAYFVCRPSVEYDSRFLQFLLLSDTYLQELTRVSKWQPPSQFDIGWEQLRAVPIIAPSIAVQRAIADYLDAETARIDALIAKKQRMIELLDERVDTLVMSWVGRSELAGASDVETVPLRRVVKKLERWVIDGGEMITAFRDGEVMTRTARGRDGFTDAWTDGARFQAVSCGDVVVHGLDGFSGAIGDSQSDGVCSPIYHVCRPDDGGDPAFYGRLLRLLATSGYLGNFATSTRERAVDFRNWDLFGRIPIPRVPIDEQVRVGNLIRSVRPLREKVRASEALAMERRQALITAAVSGEIEITGVAA